MDNKQKEQMKKGMVFGGLGLLFALSMWFIFAPSGKDKTAAEQGLNDSIPQATTEKLTENKLKPKSVIRISLCRTAKRNPLIFSIWTRKIVVFLVIWPNIGYACLLFSPGRLALIAIRTELSSEISSCWN